MGASLFLAPILLLFLVAPLLYLIVAFYITKIAGKESKYSAAIVAAIFCFFPTLYLIDYLDFSEKCSNNSRPPITVKPIDNIDTIAFITVGGDSVHKFFLWHREMNLNLKEYEYAYIVKDKLTMRNHL